MPIPPDDPTRNLTHANPDNLPHIGLVGDTYTVLLSAKDTADQPARLLCICAPAGQEDFFAQLGVPVETRTTPPPKPTPDSQAELKKKAQELAPKYKTEFLPPA